MRICDINDQYSPTGGGIRTYHHEKLKYFKTRTEHSSALVIPGKTFTMKRDGNTVTYTIESIPIAGSGYRLVVEDTGITDVLKSFKPDIVEIGSPYLLPWLTKRALGGLSIPTVGFYHCDFPDCYVRPVAEKILPSGLSDFPVGLASNYSGLVYSQMTAVFASSRVVLKKLRKAGLKRLFYTPLGVDTNMFTPAAYSESLRKELGITGGKRMLLYMARIQREKGIDQLMRAYPLIRQPSLFTLVIAGRGPMEANVREFIEKYPEVKRVSYIEERRKAAEYMASADVYLSMGHAESFGLAGLEAIASGTLPVFVDSGGAGEMSADLGILPAFEDENSKSLALSIEKALSVSGDIKPERFRAYATPRDWKNVFHRMEQFYLRIIKAYKNDHLDELETPNGWRED